MAGAVPGEREDGSSQAVLGHGGGGVGVVVLDQDEGQALLGGAPSRVAGGEVEWVEVAGEDLGLELEEGLEARHRGLEGLEGLEPVEVADVGPQGGLVAPGQAAGVLLLGSHRQDGPPQRPREPDRAGDEAAGTAEEQRVAGDHAGYGVVAAGGDGPVVDEEEVGHQREAAQGIVVLEGDGLVGEVSARHDQRPAHGVREQVVEGRVGEEDAEERALGCNLRREVRVGSTAADDDGALYGGEQGLLLQGEQGEGSSGLEVRHHHRERLLLALLPGP